VVYLRETSSAALLDRLDREGVSVLYVSPRAAETPPYQTPRAEGRLRPFHDPLGSGFQRVR